MLMNRYPWSYASMEGSTPGHVMPAGLPKAPTRAGNSAMNFCTSGC